MGTVRIVDHPTCLWMMPAGEAVHAPVARVELHVDDRQVPVGSSVYVEKQTLYGSRVGTDGVNFLVIRPRKDLGNLSKDDVLAGLRGAVTTHR